MLDIYRTAVRDPRDDRVTCGNAGPRPYALCQVRKMKQMAKRIEHRMFPSHRPRTPAMWVQWLRVEMNRAVDKQLSALPVSTLSALEVSGTDHGGRGWAEYSSVQYPDFDICEDVPSDATTYDVVIAEQVLEHVQDPARAMDSLARLTTPGGTVVVTTPFLVRLHFEPGDYWRFTPDGLRLLAERTGLEVIEVGQWGNRDCIVANFDEWQFYPQGGSLENESHLPAVVWLVARRVAASSVG